MRSWAAPTSSEPHQGHGAPAHFGASSLGVLVYELPGVVKVEWDPEVCALIHTWFNYFLRLDQFQDAIIVRALGHARANGGLAIIADTSAAKGALPDDVQRYVAGNVFREVADAGIKYIIGVSSTSAITSLSLNRSLSNAEIHGIKRLEMASVAVAVEWLKDNVFYSPAPR